MSSEHRSRAQMSAKDRRRLARLLAVADDMQARRELREDDRAQRLAGIGYARQARRHEQPRLPLWAWCLGAIWAILRRARGWGER